MGIERGLETAQHEPQAAAIQRFATTVAAIHWSDPRIADLVNTFIEIELQRRHMSQLDVCQEIREWVSSGYHKLLAPTSAELSGAIGRRWMLDNAALGCGKFSPATPREVLRALGPYQQPGGHPTTREIEIMEIHLGLEEARARGGATRSLSQALGLSTTLSKRSKRRRPITALNAPPEPMGCSGQPDQISEPVKEPVGEKTIYVNPDIVDCVRRAGLTVLSSGELQVSKTLTAAKLKAAENRCGFSVEKTSPSAEKAATEPR
jgi:hypothetical protein